MKTKVSIVKCKEYQIDDVYKKIKEAVDLLGGMSSFVRKGEKILLKPNILLGFPPEKCVNTHPIVVEAVARLVIESGGKVFLGDSPGGGSTLVHSKRAGYTEVAQRLGFEIVEFNTPKKFSNPKGIIYKSFEVDENIKKYDKIINIPKLKTHGMMFVTLAIKNLYGSVVGTDKMQWHVVAGRDYNIFAKFLVELFYFANPVLNILDGVIGMEGNGPQSGNPREIGVILVSSDGLAIDRITCEVLGINYKNVPTLIVANELGFKSHLIENIEIVGEKIEECKIKNFKLPRITSPMGYNFPRFMEKIGDRLMTVRPKINHNICNRCKICAKHCPVNAIDLVKSTIKRGNYNNYMKIDYDKCIRCFCCQEMCPNNAIDIKESIVLKLIGGFTNRFLFKE